MNERIDKLIEECTDRHFSECVGGFETFDKEKFAELIVKECIGIAQDRANFPGFPPNDVNDIIDEIREHFGVQE